MTDIPENKPRQKSLTDVPFERGFHFCTQGGRYTGITAVSLSDLTEKLKTIDDDSIAFHLERNDFQKWATDVFFDEDLAWKIDKLNVGGAEARKQLVDIISFHLNFLASI